MDFPEHPFWDFALRVYRTPGVSAACLEVQERLGVDVNILLFCLWLGEAGYGAVAPATLAKACAAVATWHEVVVKRLRAVRRVLKDGIDPAPSDLAATLRAQIQAREIDAEHIEQLMLADSVGPRPSATVDSAGVRAAHAAANVDVYLAHLKATATAADRAALRCLIDAAFPERARG